MAQITARARARVFKTRGGAQDAHEAIRPSDVTLTPELLKNDLSRDQLRLYRLIWERFVARQMSAAVYNVVSAEIESAGYDFRATGQTVKFKGYTALYVEKDGRGGAGEQPLSRRISRSARS